MALKESKDNIHQIVDVIAEILKLDVTVVDKNFLRLAGTGSYKSEVGKKAPIGSGFIHVAKSKTRISILEPGKDRACINCRLKKSCKTTANLISPILINGKIEGFLSISSFNDKQRQQLILAEQNYLNFISQMSDLIANKLALDIVIDKLSATTSQLSAILNSVHEGIIAIDNKGRITSCNVSSEIILSLNKNKIIDNHINNIFNGLDINKVLFNGIAIIDKEISVLDEFGGERVLCNVHPITTKGKIVGAVLTFKKTEEVHKYVGGFISEVSQCSFDDLIGDSSEFKNLKAKALKVAKSNSNILIRGESGTGKDLLARAIHSASNRNKGPFIAINCGAIPESLLESELFGYEEGAFTGAKKGGHPGKFELAKGGTIFLDEIGDMPLHLQVKLLRVLQDGIYYRVGGRKEVKSDVRIIAATHRDLEKMIIEGKFRQDLYFRLNVVPLVIPPLRERRDDIKTLLKHFLNYYNKNLGKRIIGFTPDVLDILIKYDWAGNVRELQNLVEYAMNMVDSKYITKEHIPELMHKKTYFESYENTTLKSIDKMIEDAFREAIKKFGKSEEGKLKIAEVLGVSRATVYRKIKEYRL